MIGTSFADEIRRAGLGGLPFSWGGDGSFQFGAAMTPEQIAAVQAVYAAHDPSRQSTSQQVAALLASAGVAQTWQLDAAMAGVLSLGISQGLTEPQVYAINPGYRQIKDLAAQIAALQVVP